MSLDDKTLEVSAGTFLPENNAHDLEKNLHFSLHKESVETPNSSEGLEHNDNEKDSLGWSAVDTPWTEDTEIFRVPPISANGQEAVVHLEAFPLEEIRRSADGYENTSVILKELSMDVVPLEDDSRHAQDNNLNEASGEITPTSRTKGSSWLVFELIIV